MQKRAAFVAGLVLAMVGAGSPVLASTPASSGTVSPPPSGQTATYTWSGTIPSGVNANSDCTQSASDSLNDHHTVTLSIPKTFYKHALLATFTITPNPGGDDVILTVTRGGTEVGSSDNGGNGSAEIVGLTGPAAGTYDAIACAFDGGPQPYTGTLTLQTDPPGVLPGGSTGKHSGVTSGGHPAIAVSQNRGQSWSMPIDVGAALGIQNAVFPEVIAGDGDRAAFGFLGTTTPGDYNDPAFGESADGTTYVGGEWHLYIAITYDRGASWTTVDATPKDPVQRGRSAPRAPHAAATATCSTSTTSRSTTWARVLFAYADGCTGACVTSTAVADNTETVKATIARQSGGLGLLSAHDAG